ncbi:putative transcriptional regulator (plasmid) [Actinacidiphila reveromycinica]|uniref:Putative transcriptional regulator n=1 Tax=Actinacidiphila reveromycinica TaxID=659352 RepID=A0A7R6TAE1_9ACTN|nr:transcriptional regulator [Streptomyces sp. SN-593]BBG20780.1 putative transcriptional regulator [Streptomyces sp. SN-593]
MTKRPNAKLRQALELSGMSRTEFARRVRAAALTWGEPHISPDATGVRRWLDGEIPRAPAPDIIADVISGEVGYRVTTYDLGLSDAPSTDRAILYNPSIAVTVEAVADLGRADVDRRSFLAAAPFTAVAAVGPSRDWLLSTLDQEPESGPRVRFEDVTAVKNMFGEFQKMDVLGGGGSGRLILAAYVSTHVLPLLRRTYTDDVRRALCEAASEQTYLLGWMAYDNGEHGIAQRYLVQSLRLAEESRNPALGAHVLAGMADQATLLGHPEEGRRLAQAGRAGLGKASPACMADLWALEARALARMGQTAEASRAVFRSEAEYARVQGGDEAEWATFIDPAYLHGEYAVTFRDLGQGARAEEHARQSIAHARKQNRARRGAMSHAALAVSHLQRRDLEAAHAAGLRTLSLTTQVKSTRAVEAVQDLQTRMQQVAGAHRLVADFTERARTLLAA